MRLASQIIIASQIEEVVKQLEILRTNERIVKIIKEEKFLVDDARFAIEKAYMASEEKTIVILAAQFFRPDAQNKLLKVIEEPPEGVEFILITPSKPTILPTIRSRLPITVRRETQEVETFELDLRQLDLASVYTFIQKHKRIDTAKAKLLVEKIGSEAMRSQRYNLDEKTLQLFYNAFKALDMGSPPQFILTTMLLKLLARKKR
jgi:DNA polymerase-3 subunit delta'